MMRKAALVFIMMFCALAMTAQDSLKVTPQWIARTSGGGLLAAGGIIGAPDITPPVAPDSRSESFGVVDCAEYVPFAFPWAMKIAGSPTRSGWGRMAVSQGIGVALMAGSVYLVKHQVNEWRPDGTDSHSFPSGHAAWAFMGATMTARELAWRSPWYAFGAYTVASGVAMQRVIDRRHYPADVAAGAGIGILSAQIGYLAGDLIFGGRGLDSRYVSERGEAANNPYLSLTTGLQFYTAHISVGSHKLHRIPALYTSLSGAIPLSGHWLVGVDASLASTPIQLDDESFTRPLTQYQLMAKAGYAFKAGPVLFTGAIGGGWLGKAHLYAPDDMVSCSGGSLAGALSITASLPLCNGLSCSAEAGYRISRHDFTVAGVNARGIDNVIYAGIASRIDF